jgi:hypothetical protein
METIADYSRYSGIKLINVFKSCPTCDKDHYMSYLNSEIRCGCGTMVSFSIPQKRYIIRTESQFWDVDGTTR